MNRFEKEEIEEVEKKVLSELNRIEKCKNKEERVSRANILFNIHQILSNYEALEPTLQRFFNERQIKMKWGEHER